MKAVPVWEIALPVLANNGHAYTAAHDKFRVAALEIAGGYTVRPDGQGAWRNKSGKTYYDEMRPYRVACELEDFARIVEYAFRVFSDQDAFYTEHSGAVVIVGRDDVLNAASIGVNVSRLQTLLAVTYGGV